MAPLAGKKRIDIVVNVAPDIGSLDADEVRIRQVFFNLLSNAIKFTGEGRSAGLDARGEGDRALVELWDEGIGIEEGDRRRIFEPFEQVRRAEGVNLGTGLGLAIAERLVGLHDGSIELKSRLGEGSRFTVTLPGRLPERRLARASAAREARPARISSDRARILVVEDNPVNRKLMMAMLEIAGLEASFAASGEEALGIAAVGNFDLVFMDINLPGIDGLETMRRMRKVPAADKRGLRRTSDLSTSFVALPAHAMVGDAERFIAMGMDEVITKPIDMGRFFAVLSRFLPEQPRITRMKRESIG